MSKKKLNSPPRNRVVFLDIDGVLVTDRAHYTINNSVRNEPMMVFDPIGIKLLNNLCLKYYLSVVFCSTWRHKYDLKTILRTHGFTGNFHEDINTPLGGKFSATDTQNRGFQIEDWLEEHQEVSVYIIFDDLPLNGYVGHHICTDYNDGILSSHYLEAISLLESQIKNLDNPSESE